MSMESLKLQEISKELLKGRYLLTALELYAEAIENGQEVAILSEYFSDSSNFESVSPGADVSASSSNLNRSVSQTTIDSLDWARYSEDGEKIQEDKITILEFELRKAQKTIQNLRDNLTQTSVLSESTATESANQKEISPIERATLNFLVNEYLCKNHFKITANTFADENDSDDLDSWESIGLNIPRPPQLLQILREKGPKISFKKEAECQTDDGLLIYKEKLCEENKKLKEQVETLENQNKCLQQASDKSLSDRKDEVILEKTCVRYSKNSESASTSLSSDFLNNKPSIPHTKKPDSFCQENECENIKDCRIHETVENNFGINIMTQGREKEIIMSHEKEQNNLVGQENNLNHFLGRKGKEEVTIDLEKVQKNVINEEEEVLNKNFNNDDVSLSPNESENDGLYIEDCIENLMIGKCQLSHQNHDNFDQSTNHLCPSSESNNLNDIKIIDENKDTFDNKDTSKHSKSVAVNASTKMAKNSTKVQVEQKNTNKIIYTEELAPCDLLDPQKCDRLPPVGASSDSEYVPYSTLSGEFIVNHKNEAKKLFRNSLNKSKKISEYLESKIYSECFCDFSSVESRIQTDLGTIGRTNVIDMVTNSLHNIAPNVILARREELIPLLVYVICHHGEKNERERLIELLFNLSKKPEKNQRTAILLGIVAIARCFSPKKLEEEVLPHCLDHLSHKYVEKRLLVVESITVLAPCITSSIRDSLLISMLLQLLHEEKDFEIRQAAFSSLSLIITYLDDSEKFSSLLDCLISCLSFNIEAHGGAKKGQKSNILLFLASLAHWSVWEGRLVHFIHSLLKKSLTIATEIKKYEDKKFIMCKELNKFIFALNYCTPYIFLSLFNNLSTEDTNECIETKDVNVSIVKCDEIQIFKDELSSIVQPKHCIEIYLQCVGKYLALKQSNDNLHNYLKETMIPSFLELISLLEISMKEIIISVIKFLTRIAFYFGTNYSEDVIISGFKKHFEEMDEGMRFKSVVFVVYLVAIVAEFSNFCGPSVQEFLSQQICVLAISSEESGTCHSFECQLEPPRLCIDLLIEKQYLHEEVLTALWSCVVHENSFVRSCTANLWIQLVGKVKESELSSRIVPALVTLATDPDVRVQAAVIEPLVYVIAHCTCLEIKERATLQLEMVCDLKQVMSNFCLQLAIGKCCSSMGHTVPSSVLKNLFLPIMCKVVLGNQENTVEEKFYFEETVLEAFTSLIPCSLSEHLVAHFILPPLNQLQKTLGASSLKHMATITNLTKEYTIRLQQPSTTEKIRQSISSGAISSIGNSLSQGMVSVAPGVEDVKNRVTKMFSGNVKSQNVKPTNISTFFKKK